MGLRRFLFGDKNKTLLGTGYDIMYYKESRKLIDRHYLSNPSINLTGTSTDLTVTRVMKEVIGEAEYLRYLERGWTLTHVESPSYGQLFQHRYMAKNFYQLKAEVEAWERAQTMQVQR